VPREQVARVHASSGTTGKPTVVGYTRNDIDTGPTWWRVPSALRAGGRATSCTWPTATACSPAGWARTTAPSGWAARWCRCRGGQTEKQVQLITDFKPDIIMVTPSYMQVIIEELRRQGLDPRAMSLKVGIFGAEPWTEAMRPRSSAMPASTRWTSTACPR
jgi:phenylacetate-CoA ligase